MFAPLKPAGVAPLEAPSLELTKGTLGKELLFAPFDTLKPLFGPLQLEQVATVWASVARSGCSLGLCSLGAEQVASLEAPVCSLETPPLEPLCAPLELEPVAPLAFAPLELEQVTPLEVPILRGWKHWLHWKRGWKLSMRIAMLRLHWMKG